MTKRKKPVQTRRPAARKGSVSLTSKRRTVHHKLKRVVRARSPLHRRVVLHPTTLFGLLVLGVFLVGLTLKTFALQYTVTAKIAAPPLSTGATISSPTPGQKFESRPITISGQCPNDSYVKLFRNGMFSGSAACVNNVFQIQSDLFVGLNDLRAQAYNLTDDPGPQTPIVQVTYAPPTSAPDNNGTGSGGQYIPSSSTGSSGNVPSGSPLLLASDYHFNVFSTTQPFQWTLRFQAGTAPYHATIDWGDGQRTKTTVPNHDEFTITHSYAEPGYYPIIVSGHDAKGRTVSLQLVALIKLPGAAGTISDITGSTHTPVVESSSGMKHWLWLAWPTYLVVSLMAASFWLGERREIMLLLKGGKHVQAARPRHRH